VNPTNSERSWTDCDKTPFPGETTYSFNAVTTSSGTVDPTPAPVVPRPDAPSTTMVTFSQVQAAGVSANSAVDGAFAFTGWGTGAPDGATQFNQLSGSRDDTKYYEFQLTPAAMYDLQAGINTFSFDLGRSLDGIRTFCVRGSVNNFATNLPIIGTTGVTVLTSAPNQNVGFINVDAGTTFRITIDPPNGVTTGTPPQNAGYSPFQQAFNAPQAAPVTFRIYAWNAEDAAGTFYVDNLTVDGYGGKVENVENYMEYSYCSKMFTLGQRNQARAALLSPVYQRDNLWTEANLIATGVADGHQGVCPPEADFYAQVGQDIGGANESVTIPFNDFSCTNTNVRFVDNSSRGVPESWSWTFQDGNPATSNQRNPMVQFTSPGWKTVSLTVTNAQGSSTKTDQFAIEIGSTAYNVGPFYEGFEGQTGTTIHPFLTDNFESNHTYFRRYSAGGYTGSACVMLNSGERNQVDLIRPENDGDIDDLISPLVNLQGAPVNSFSFRYAYTTSTTVVENITESIEVFRSTDCGRTWESMSTITGTDLVTNGASGSTPPGPSGWKFKSFTLTNSMQVPNTRFRIRFKSSPYSGNLFIDNINIGGFVGMDEFMREGFISIYPNPTNDQFSLQVAGMESSRTELTICDLRGAVVFTNVYQPKAGALIELSGRELGLAEGMYTVRASNAAGSSVQTLIVGR
jgi:PKD repeat protein